MSKPLRPTQDTSESDLRWLITDDGSRTLEDLRLQETYHSGCGAVAETLLVYLRNSGVWDRLRVGQPTDVLEYGLGTGTAFLLTATAAETFETPLEFHAIENRLLPASVLRELELVTATERFLAQGQDGWDCAFSEDLAQSFLANLTKMTQHFVDWRAKIAQAELNTLMQTSLSDFVQLQVWHGDAEYLPDGWLEHSTDAIYFDPFAPSVTPQLWCESIFETAFSKLRPNGRLTSYCVKHAVRKDLERCGVSSHACQRTSWRQTRSVGSHTTLLIHSGRADLTNC